MRRCVNFQFAQLRSSLVKRPVLLDEGLDGHGTLSRHLPDNAVFSGENPVLVVDRDLAHVLPDKIAPSLELPFFDELFGLFAARSSCNFISDGKSGGCSPARIRWNAFSKLREQCRFHDVDDQAATIAGWTKTLGSRLQFFREQDSITARLVGSR